MTEHKKKRFVKMPQPSAVIDLRLEMMIRQFYLRLTFFKYFLNWLDFLVVSRMTCSDGQILLSLRKATNLRIPRNSAGGIS